MSQEKGVYWLDNALIVRYKRNRTNCHPIETICPDIKLGYLQIVGFYLAIKGATIDSQYFRSLRLVSAG